MRIVVSASLVVAGAAAFVAAAFGMTAAFLFLPPTSIMITAMLGYAIGRLALFPSDHWLLAWQLCAAVIGSATAYIVVSRPNEDFGVVVASFAVIGMVFGIALSQWGKLMRRTAS